MLRMMVFALLLPCLCLADTSWNSKAERWLDQEFSLSTLSREQQLEEFKWFAKAAEPFRDITVRVVSERIDTHWYESNVLVKAFYDITGIRVIHEVTGEDDVIKKLQNQIATGVNLYDAYVNDSDLIGYHSRSGEVRALDSFMADEGKNITLPTLDIKDFIGLQFSTGSDGHLYQLPDQQFANLYWYRADWFEREDLRAQFREIYGYKLGVPQNWAAYEDIAEFFTVHVKNLDGQRVWGHMDYGKADPSLGWRISDAWLSLAGAGDIGLPNGFPVDEWGIRSEGCRPAGASVARGGALDSPASVYAMTKFRDWLINYAPPVARDLNFTEAGRWLSKGNIAQQIWWYTAFASELSKPGSPIVNEDGSLKWRMAPSPKGAYWQPGMKLGYQDSGSWTFLKNTPIERVKAAWLYAQFVVSKSVSLRKTQVGLTPIRDSDIRSDYLTQNADRLGGLVEFYRSRGRQVWTPTGINVPDYMRLFDLWWQYAGQIIHDGKPVQSVLTDMAQHVDNTLETIAAESTSPCRPKLNAVSSTATWLQRPGAPKPRIDEAAQQPETLSYEDAIRVWQ